MTSAPKAKLSIASDQQAGGSSEDIRQRALVPTRLSSFRSFDGQVAAVAWHQRPDRYRQLEATGIEDVPRIARGAGLSYAPASFGSGILVIEMTRFCRVLEFAESTGSIRVEAGTPIGDLLSWAVARGRYLPVVPGHPDITIGGCIAADVHGKNPGRDGTFRDSILALTLFHPALGFVTASPTERPELFEATCGGFGLTGIIVDATLALPELPARSLRIASRQVQSLAEAAELILASSAPLCYSWHGAFRGTGSIGPGLVFLGDWTDATGSDGRRRRTRNLTAENRGALSVCLWNPATAAAAAQAFSLANRYPRSGKLLSIYESSFPFEHRTIYHRFFGRRGLGEIQMMIPTGATGRFLDALNRVLREHRPTVTMVSLKSFCGRALSLSPSGSGLLLALDYVRSRSTAAFESELDDLAIELGAQPNVAKDSRLSARVVESTIPGWQSFRERLRRLDPDRIFQSDLSRRLAL